MLYSYDLLNSGETVISWNGRGTWTQLLVSFWATRFQSSSVIYCKRTLILREICHNTKSVRCVPPVEEAFPRPLGHPVKHREIYSLSYLGSYHLTLTEREGMERPQLKITKLNTSEPQILCNCVSVCERMSVCGLSIVGKRHRVNLGLQSVLSYQQKSEWH